MQDVGSGPLSVNTTKRRAQRLDMLLWPPWRVMELLVDDREALRANVRARQS